MIRIILVGFMASGKSTAGKRIARQLNVPFFDSDKEIEKIEQDTIAGLFEKYGENGFRELEKKWLLDFSLQHEEFVLSTGGGMPCYNNLIDVMNTIGTTIYLNVTVNELAERLKRGKKKRPLVSQLPDEEIPEFITTKLAEREKYYQKALITTKTNNQKPESIIHLWQEFHSKTDFRD